jgi:hypothetical protein
MTSRTLWTILLRISGLYVFFQFLNLLPNLFSSIIVVSEHGGQDALNITTFYILISATYALIISSLIFKTDWLIDKLKLNKGITEEKLELNMHRSSILHIIVIVTGLFILIDSLPLLAKQIIAYFDLINVYRGLKNDPAAGWILYYLIKVFLGYFMVTCSRLIVNFIERKRKRSETA